MKKELLLLATLINFFVPLFSQWNPNPEVNNPVVLVAAKGLTAVSKMATATDGNGGMFIAWVDTRNIGTTGADVFITRVLNTGTVAPGFAAGGNPVCLAPGNQFGLSITGDGIDGVVVSWNDHRNIGATNTDIYAQRIDGGGNMLWATNGVAVAAGPNDENSPEIELTESNRIAIVWRNEIPAPSLLETDLCANFLDLSNGSKVLGTDITVISKNNTQSNQQILRDGIGGFMVVWTDGRVSNSNTHLYAQRIDQNGNLKWGPSGNETEGQLIINSSGNVLLPRVAHDGTGGLVVAFASTRVSPTDANIYAQKVNSNGIPQWAANGVSITTAASSQSNVRIAKSGASSFIVGWVERKHSTDIAQTDSVDIYAQGLDQDGNMQWAPGGVAVVRAPGHQPLSPEEGFGILEDQIGGAYFVWDDTRATHPDIYAHRILYDGTNGWQPNGMPISNPIGSGQIWPKLLASGDRLIIAWQDSRTQPNAEIYASQVLSNGVLPVEVLELNAKPYGRNTLVQWTSKNEKVLSHFEVQRSKDGIDFLMAGNITARNMAGTHQYSFEDIKPGPGFNYYRVKSVDKDGSFAYSNIVLVKSGDIADNNLHFYPNPVMTTLNLQVGNLPSGRYVVKIIGVDGRLIQSQQVHLRGNSQFETIGIPMGHIGTGLYKVQLINTKGEPVSAQTLWKQ